MKVDSNFILKKKKEFLGQKYAAEAEKLNDKDFNILKWTAVLTGSITEFLGIKEKIETGNRFKVFFFDLKLL